MVVATLQHTFSGLILKKQIYNDISQPNQPEIHFEHMVQAQIHEKKRGSYFKSADEISRRSAVDNLVRS